MASAAASPASSANKVVKIDVISDFVCPWCYIGHMELHRALDNIRAANVPVDFQVEYHPYSLIPGDVPTTPESKKEALEKKLGLARYEGMASMVNERAKPFGTRISFEGPYCSSFRPHRVMVYAYHKHGSEVQGKFVLAIYKALFEEDLDIGNTPVLASIATRAGVFPSENDAMAWIESDKYVDQVKSISAEAARKIKGVPLTILGQKFLINGSQPSSCYEKVLNKFATCDFSVCPSTAFPKHIHATAEAPMCSPLGNKGDISDSSSSDSDLTPPASVKNMEMCGASGSCGEVAGAVGSS